MRGSLYAETLYGRRDIRVEFSDGSTSTLAVDDWMTLHPGDEALVGRCVGPTLDVGCGPGRFVTELGARGHVALGIDVTPAAVALTARAGGSALLRDVFDQVPGTGRWQTLLLADGNIGIGGEPVALLDRAGALLAATGQVLVDVHPPGSGLHRLRVRLCAGTTRSEWFWWATVGLDVLPEVAARAGFVVADSWADGHRWTAVLARRRGIPAG